jgi:hypothetical protein
MMHGLLRVYMHAGDGRQVTVRYVRAGDLLGAPALIGGPAPVFVQAVTHGTAFFFDIDRVKRAARNDADAIEVYRRHYRNPGPTRTPMLEWSRELPIEGHPRDVVRIVDASSYSACISAIAGSIR